MKNLSTLPRAKRHWKKLDAHEAATTACIAKNGLKLVDIKTLKPSDKVHVIAAQHGRKSYVTYEWEVSFCHESQSRGPFYVKS